MGDRSRTADAGLQLRPESSRIVSQRGDGTHTRDNYSSHDYLFMDLISFNNWFSILSNTPLPSTLDSINEDNKADITSSALSPAVPSNCRLPSSSPFSRQPVIQLKTAWHMSSTFFCKGSGRVR